MSIEPGHQAPFVPAAMGMPETPRVHLAGPVLRYVYLAAGWLAVGIGIIGIAMPGIPTTFPLLVALWCFSRSSPRLRNWLLTHPRFGPLLSDWHHHGIIPTKAKIVALSLMAASLVILSVASDLPAIAIGAIGGLFVVVGAFIVTRPAKKWPHDGEN